MSQALSFKLCQSRGKVCQVRWEYQISLQSLNKLRGKSENHGIRLKGQRGKCGNMGEILLGTEKAGGPQPKTQRGWLAFYCLIKMPPQARNRQGNRNTQSKF